MRILKKVITVICNILFFMMYFYIIFVNFVSYPIIESRSYLIKFVIGSFFIASAIPGIIIWQVSYIRRLEKRLDELEEENLMLRILYKKSKNADELNE